MSPRDLLYALPWQFAADNGPDPGVDVGKAALYSMIAAIVVAFITVTGNVLINKGKAGGPGSRTAKRTAAHYEALKLFITLNTDADVRKIKDGYESIDEVRRAGTP